MNKFGEYLEINQHCSKYIHSLAKMEKDIYDADRKNNIKESLEKIYIYSLIK